ncbi:protein arginine methyltransferase NDUFAF7 homolog, mitochondrial isoform X1 [Stomoxys calcitrans]|uniref:protein arginine methyltransferase NDUFAF7 homolog, mitochondrial isoform X1 n=1 Tax=Stomoxys calcitrans TaxID=35570 RepID=UPI0027E34C03|nr:protein arginine methyltransferase NDUFAF7 homolog, mitochondrial isoform X1 [Stomoxys calcitrans]XP_059218325.1 protein arginine methyltransferase NDUFAF7 homolog, mitochondrial isoform X1 [Stomoxys calcitrans]
MFRPILKKLTNVSRRQYCYKSVKRPTFQKETSPRRPKGTPVDKAPKDNVDLTKHLQAKILATGPITVAEYMREVLTNPHSGYYMNRDVFGKEGDFITSPEISQIFGELVAVWILSEWQKMGSPKFQLVELGPGRGTLMRDVLKVLSKFKLNKDFSIHMVEISPHLSKQQAQLLCYSFDDADANVDMYYRKGETASGTKIFWYSRLEDVPKKFSVVLAHEFFDALPIHKFQFDNGLWKEVLIDIAENSTSDFRYVLSKNQTPMSKIFNPVAGDTRKIIEYSLESDRLIGLLVERFERDGGLGLIMDYGHLGEKGDTFRAFRKHALHDPLKFPGTADLTADVDFRQMKSVAERNHQTVCFGPVEQGVFLNKMQGEVRLESILRSALPENHSSIRSAYQMLTHREQMGARFKFFSMFPFVLKDHLTKFPVNGFH